jgi:hypothetical protein
MTLSILPWKHATSMLKSNHNETSIKGREMFDFNKISFAFPGPPSIGLSILLGNSIPALPSKTFQYKILILRNNTERLSKMVNARTKQY